MTNPWKRALERYRRTWGWSGWQHGALRWHRAGFYTLPRWVDDVQGLAGHIWLRLRGRCIQCRTPRPHHKLGCYHNWRIQDDLLELCPPFHAWLVRRPGKRGS